MMLLDAESRVVSTSGSAVGFATDGSGAWPVWDRYLTVQGRRAYHLGNVCGTCSYLFERMEDANCTIDVGALDRELSAGGERLCENVVDALAELVPVGTYRIALLRVAPVNARPGSEHDYFSIEQVENEGGVDPFWGLPHNPKVMYYRLTGRSAVPVSDLERGGGKLFEFLVPMFPETLLSSERIEFYEAELARGVEPTAVALSVLDVKGPALTGVDHWCLGHFLLDGHHKVAAAARTARSLTLIAFVALDHGVSSPEQVDIALTTNGRPSMEARPTT